ncbi:hypothetical protein K2173_006226 [Erythroxylum novogranatense]|uniref:Uncharacterized protein n=1 Tax=Erythroxylum novogranatense TaxID=1862640 RepID=A0AAV8TCF9_9ROSI|nr:hypothetical protein K2173_006226 [Erythroxylum novogranatense]
MSRCFPYPPPGCEKIGVRDQALIDSIKRKEEKARRERKKEKKRERKEKKARENGEVENKKHGHKKRHRDKRSQQDQKGGEFQKIRESDAEHSEKSSLTEEYGNPIGSHNSFCCSLESNKKQKQRLPTDSVHNSGSNIRIWLPFQRHRDPEVLPCEEQPCSASWRAHDTAVQCVDEPVFIPCREQGEFPCSDSSSTGLESAARFGKEKLSLSSVHSNAKQEDSTLQSSLCSRCSPSSAKYFKNLIEDWVAPHRHCECTDLDDQEWFVRGWPTHNQNFRSEACEVDSVGLGQGEENYFPHGCYLPEVDTYALPYALPF